MAKWFIHSLFQDDTGLFVSKKKSEKGNNNRQNLYPGLFKYTQHKHMIVIL